MRKVNKVLIICSLTPGYKLDLKEFWKVTWYELTVIIIHYLNPLQSHCYFNRVINISIKNRFNLLIDIVSNVHSLFTIIMIHDHQHNQHSGMVPQSSCSVDMVLCKFWPHWSPLHSRGLHFNWLKSTSRQNRATWSNAVLDHRVLNRIITINRLKTKQNGCQLAVDFVK